MWFHVKFVQVTFLCMLYFFVIVAYNRHMGTDSAFELWCWKFKPRLAQATINLVQIYIVVIE